MGRLFFFLGGLFGGLAVVLGAFGAHVLKARLSPQLLGTFETGVQYQIYHALALLFIALVNTRRPVNRLLTLSGWSFVVGTVLFSGSLYLLIFSGRPSYGFITPLGGIAFVIGWLGLVLTACIRGQR